VSKRFRLISLVWPLTGRTDAGIVSPGGFVVGTGQALNLASLRQWR
jgi:hypothetical protein